MKQRRFYYKVSALEEVSKTRPEGYLHDVLSRGQADGDRIYLAIEDHAALRAKYAPIQTPAPPAQSGIRLGDRIHTLIHPFARLIDWLFGTHFATCAACQRRRRWLNALFPPRPRAAAAKAAPNAKCCGQT